MGIINSTLSDTSTPVDTFPIPGTSETSNMSSFLNEFLSQLDEKGRELMDKYHPKIQVDNYGDLIHKIGMGRISGDYIDYDYLYMLTAKPIVSHIHEISDGTKSNWCGHPVLRNLPRFILSCLFYPWTERSGGSGGEVIRSRTICLTKSCYPLINAAITAYETHGDGKIKEDDMVKIKDWMSRNGPVVKSSFKQ